MDLGLSFNLLTNWIQLVANVLNLGERNIRNSLQNPGHPFPAMLRGSAPSFLFVLPRPWGGSTADFSALLTRPAGRERSNHHLRLSGKEWVIGMQAPYQITQQHLAAVCPFESDTLRPNWQASPVQYPSKSAKKRRASHLIPLRTYETYHLILKTSTCISKSKMTSCWPPL